MTLSKNKILNTCLLVFSILIAFFVSECLCGYFFDHLPQKFNNGKRIVQIYMGEKPTIPAEIEPHPYLLYQNTKNFSADGFLQHNSLRYRNGEFSLKKPSATIRIMALGGSTTYMYPYIKNPQDAWPSQLRKKLQEKISLRLEVINAGQSYATSAELLAAYVFRHRYLHPDILIVHEGVNDIAALMFDHYDPEYAHFRGAGNGLNPRPWERSLLRHCRFSRVVYALCANIHESVDTF